MEYKIGNHFSLDLKVDIISITEIAVLLFSHEEKQIERKATATRVLDIHLVELRKIPK